MCVALDNDFFGPSSLTSPSRLQKVGRERGGPSGVCKLNRGAAPNKHVQSSLLND